MKILLAIHHFPPRYTGGAEWEAYNTAVGLRARGHTVRVLCVERIDRGAAPPGTVIWTDDEYDGVPVRRLSYDLSSAPDMERWEYDKPWIGDHVRALLAAETPDIFHLMGGYLLSGRVLWEARAQRVPAVVSLMDFWFLCRRLSLWRSDGQLSHWPVDPTTCARCVGEESRRYRWLGRLAPGLAQAYWDTRADRRRLFADRQAFLSAALPQAAALIGRSQFVRQTFIAAGVPAERIHFIRQGRDFPGLDPAALTKAPARHLRVGYLGQVAAHKGVHVLLEAARLLPAAPLSVKVFGSLQPFPDYVSRLRQVMAGDPRLELAGPYQGLAELRARLQELDVVVVPSLWYENSPNVILEAFAHRTPVIVSDLGGMAELVEEGVDGLRFPVGEAGALARCFQRLLTEPDLLVRLQAGVRPVKSTAGEMDELEALYHQVLSRPMAEAR